MMINLKNTQIYLFFLSVLLIISCKPQNKPDVSKIKLQIKIDRFDQDLYQGRLKSVTQTDSLLQKKYGVFYDDFIDRMVANPTMSNTDALTGLYKDNAYTDLNQEVDSVFKNLDVIENDLTQAFKYLKYNYPKAKLPRFIAFLSGFAYQTPIGNNYMGIGLDMFLGKNSKFYGALVASIPRYQSNRFAPNYIVPRVLEYYIREEIVKENDEDRTFLAKMIYNGKILYFLDKVLPESENDTTKIGYTSKQLDWCKTNENNIWAFYLENNLIYESEFSKMQVYLSDGPFTLGLGENNNSAPKLGVFTGWQIVRKYMKLNPKITLPQLMAEQDAQKILTLARYKPK